MTLIADTPLDFALGLGLPRRAGIDVKLARVGERLVCRVDRAPGAIRHRARTDGAVMAHPREIAVLSVSIRPVAATPPNRWKQPRWQEIQESMSFDRAQTINALFKAEIIHRRGPGRSFEAFEFATLEWVDWFNNRRMLEPIGNIPSAEAEAAYSATLETRDRAA